jgi:hypothetical protein
METAMHARPLLDQPAIPTRAADRNVYDFSGLPHAAVARERRRRRPAVGTISLPMHPQDLLNGYAQPRRLRLRWRIAR